MNLCKVENKSPIKSITDSLPSEGSPGKWNAIWNNDNSSKSSKECLFTRTNTKTIYEFWQRAYAHDLLCLIKDKAYTDFLELGSGRATTSMYLNDAGYDKITLIDLSQEARKLANRNFDNFHLTFKDFILADVRNTLLPNECFDCIYNIGLLEHFNQPEEVLKEAYRLLRPEGLIFMPIFPEIKSPHCHLVRLLFNPFSFIKKLFTTIPIQDKGMIRTKLPKEAYVEICKAIGFKKVECMYYNPFPKIVRDCGYENLIVLNAYKLVHFFRTLRGRKLKFQTTSFFGSSYLLIAYK